MWRSLLASLLVLSIARPAGAVDVWSTPYPGVRMLRRTTSQPVVMWAMVIDSCAAGVRFRATSPSEGPRTTSSFGRLVGAQLAINGDFFDHDFGLNVGDGAAWPYPDTDHSGNISFGPNRIEMTPDYVVLPGPAPWVTEQLGGRWTLLNDGVAQLGIDDNGPASGGFVCAPGLRHPRTAIGLSRDRRTVYLLVADGRSSASIGMTCDEMIGVFQELGAWDAMGLDGGGSTTLWSGGAVLNHPTDGSERTVRNHLAVFASGAGPAPQCGATPTVTEPTMAAPVTGAALPAVTPLAAPSRFTALGPARLFDSRTAADSARLIRGDGASEGPLSLTARGAYNAWSAAGVPASATAVWLNVTAIGQLVPGYLTVFPHGRPRPETSNVNYDIGQIVANASPVALGESSQIDFEVHTAVHAVADLGGYFAPSGAGLATIAPRRVLDTRTASAPLRAGVTRAVDVGAARGATGVVASVAVIARGAAGYLTVSPCGAALPPTSNLNFTPGDVVANAVMSGLGAAQLCLTSNVDVDALVDVTGYLTPTAPLSYVPLFPQRVLDTRLDTTLYRGRVAERQVLEIPVQRAPGMPASVGAVAANITVVDAAGPGFVTAFPCGTPAPETSVLNYTAARPVGGLSVTAVGGGSLCLFASTRAHVLVDVLGVWVTPPAAPPDAGAPDVPAPRDVPGALDAQLPRDVVAPTDAQPPRDVARLDAGAAVDAPLVDATPSDGPLLVDDAVTATEIPHGACGCRLAPEEHPRALWLLALAAAHAARRRRRGNGAQPR